jgi:cytochrome c5
MRRAHVLFGAVGAALLAFVVPALAQSELPEGPDRDLVARECQTCHGLQVLVGRKGKRAEEWAAIVDQMEGNGLNVPSDDRAKIIEYLATYLGPARKEEPVTVLDGVGRTLRRLAGLR